MTTVSDLCAAMESLAPTRLAGDWDNVGLLLGRRDVPIERVLLCIDLTQAVADEAVNCDAQAIVSYHPILFEPAKRVTADDVSGRTLLTLFESKIAVYSPHTALDASVGGMADWLASGIGSGECSPIEPASEQRESEAVKIVTHVPREDVEAVRIAMSAAGAGQIGNYTECSTQIACDGTFKGGDQSRPVIGNTGELHRVQEYCLTMVCSNACIAAVVHAARHAHPYEEPPIQVIPLMAIPLLGTGGGRVVRLDDPRTLIEIAESMKSHLGVQSLRVAEATRTPMQHTIVSCCPGAGGSMLAAAEAAGSTLHITGEMRHHDVLAACERGMCIMLAGHTNTERGYLPALRDRISSQLSVEVRIATTDHTPWRTI
ncbi:MAG: Nif3-like dinuclear metal center hexameric protein [Phycisphaerales bacterium]|nr:Nif3-like dinuclear metal center hexameric protein [Phycisphaerales bacterium]